jgi:hypothetical protein
MTAIEVCNNWADNSIEGLKKSYEDKHIKASGRWGKSLQKKVSESNGKINVVIEGEQYTGVFVYGRRKNKNNSQKQIRNFAVWAGNSFIKQWVKDNGLNLNPIAVAYNIAKNGIEVPNNFGNNGKVISDVINDKSIKELVDSIGSVYLGKVSTDINNTLA